MPDSKIPIYQPDLTGNERAYVDDCLETTWISSKGGYIEKFEKGFSEFCGIKHAAAVSNGTVALHLAMLALGIGPGDEVIVPTLTYIASVNAIAYCGAKPVFVDSLADSWQTDPADIKNKITESTKAILVVHLYGQPCEMDEITKIASENKLLIIEDCAEAIGSKYKGKHVGNFGDIATFSFFGNKTITTGEGGMVLSNNPELIKTARHLKGQGLADGTEYWHDVIGYNYRMTNICAAIGVAQLERIGEFIKRKEEIANFYQRSLEKNKQVKFHKQMKDTEHSYWMCSVLVENSNQRDELRKYLQVKNIETRPLFPPIHTMPMYRENDESFPIAQNLSERGINLPSWPGLSEDELSYIVTSINSFFGEKDD